MYLISTVLISIARRYRTAVKQTLTSHGHRYMVGVDTKTMLILNSKRSCLSPYRLNLVACVRQSYICYNESTQLTVNNESTQLTVRLYHSELHYLQVHIIAFTVILLTVP